MEDFIVFIIIQINDNPIYFFCVVVLLKSVTPNYEVFTNIIENIYVYFYCEMIN